MTPARIQNPFQFYLCSDFPLLPSVDLHPEGKPGWDTLQWSQANSGCPLLPLHPSAAVKRVQTNKSATVSCTSKTGGHRMGRELGELSEVYSPSSGWLRSDRIDLVFMTEKKKNQTNQYIHHISSSFTITQLKVNYTGENTFLRIILW